KIAGLPMAPISTVTGFRPMRLLPFVKRLKFKLGEQLFTFNLTIRSKKLKHRRPEALITLLRLERLPSIALQDQPSQNSLVKWPYHRDRVSLKILASILPWF